MGLHCLQVPHKDLQNLPMFDFWATRQSGSKRIGTSLSSMYKTSPKVIKLLSCSTQLSMNFFLLINVKMPTMVGILIFMCGKNSIFGLSEPKKSRFFYIYFLYL